MMRAYVHSLPVSDIARVAEQGTVGVPYNGLGSEPVCTAVPIVLICYLSRGSSLELHIVVAFVFVIR